MLVGGVDRCARCGTLLRGGRGVCPSCGMNQTAAEGTPTLPVVPEVVHETAAAPAKKSICPMCMSSVREETLIAHNRTRICPSCYETIKGKMDRKKNEV